jgi:hypothetical protein
MPPEMQHFQQHPSGQYEVVPPPMPGQNTGHSGHNPYDFIVNPNAVKARTGFGGGGSFIKRIVLLAVGVVALFVIGGILISSLAPKGSVPGLISIAERQQEIIRVSTAATQLATTQDGQNLVNNVEVSVTTSQQRLLAYLAAHGVKVGTGTLGSDYSSQTNATLANAAAANDYDLAVAQNLSLQLQAYKALLQSTFKLASNKQTQLLLQSDYNGANLLLKQANKLITELQ